MGQKLFQEGLGGHLGGAGQYLGAGAAPWPQRPLQYPEAGTAVGGAGANSVRASLGPPEWAPALGVPAVPPFLAAAAPASAAGPACGW